MSRRSLGDPDYFYQPLSDETKARMREAHLKRLGIPPGHCRVYGVIVPLALKKKLYDLVARIRREERKRAKQDLEAFMDLVEGRNKR